jgi:CrcB protein
VRLLWICLGGAVGTGARYLVGGLVARTAGTSFPWATLAVNAIGSFLLGLVVVVGQETEALSPTLRQALAVGVLGGFTTYSTFNYETLDLLRTGAWSLGLANVAGTLVLCLVAGFLGVATGRWAAGL